MWKFANWLDLECCPKGPYVEDMVPRLWTYWEMVETLEGGAKREEVRSLGVYPGKGYCDLVPPSLLPGYNEVNRFPFLCMSTTTP